MLLSAAACSGAADSQWQEDGVKSAGLKIKVEIWKMATRTLYLEAVDGEVVVVVEITEASIREAT